ncbi:MAG: LysR family transcriptional regulator [Bdellovibrionales bacterium]|nr:LysR family transcriptional regulator [Bdellovibrionales bacterium]
MDINRMRYFISLAKTGSVTKAAEIHRISPPAFSKAIKVFEEEVGHPLTLPHGRGILLTDKAKKLVTKLEEIIQQIDALKESTQNNTETDILSIATFEVFSTYFLRFLDEPGLSALKLRLHEALPGEIERLVADRIVDFGITYIPVPYPDIEYLKIVDTEMGVFVKKGAFKGIEQPHIPFVTPIFPIRATPTKARGLDGWPENAYKRRILHEVTLLTSAIELCRQGRVAGYFPLFIAREFNMRSPKDSQLERKPSPYGNRKCTVPVYIVKRNSDIEHQRMKQLARAIRTICK